MLSDLLQLRKKAMILQVIVTNRLTFDKKCFLRDLERSCIITTWQQYLIIIMLVMRSCDLKYLNLCDDSLAEHQSPLRAVIVIPWYSLWNHADITFGDGQRTSLTEDIMFEIPLSSQLIYDCCLSEFHEIATTDKFAQSQTKRVIIRLTNWGPLFLVFCLLSVVFQIWLNLKQYICCFTNICISYPNITSLQQIVIASQNSRYIWFVICLLTALVFCSSCIFCHTFYRLGKIN